MPYVRPKVARELLGVTDETLRSWASEGLLNCITGKAGHRFYDVESFLATRENPQSPPSKGCSKYLYCRVSSYKQKEDLERQISYLQAKYPGYEVIKDIASGLNFHRKGFQRLLDECINGTVKEVVVAHKDRLCRFAYEHFEWLLSKYGVRIVVDGEDDKHSPEAELSEDLMSIIHVFSSRHYGQRRRILKKEMPCDIQKESTPTTEEEKQE